MNKYLGLIFLAIFLVACNTSQETKKPTQNTVSTIDAKKKLTETDKQKLIQKGYKIIDFIDPKTKDTILMQQYFMAFLKKGKNRSHNTKQADSLQRLHLAHLKRMYDLGYADISGPFGDLGDIRGITIYNVPTIEMADSLANSDPMVKAGRLEIEMHPWWAGKGLPLR
ncbi:hypothetical protein [uncultured Kordia sp.]|uniref:YciI family protein n=1 Tax=uncultured Kordia sp. TaxID=507699 RepID=UPI0026039DAC|nr:hypothetical protein [uncultured Kordia sp.]